MDGEWATGLYRKQAEASRCGEMIDLEFRSRATPPERVLGAVVSGCWRWRPLSFALSGKPTKGFGGVGPSIGSTHLLDDVQAIDKALGRVPNRNWNSVSREIENLLHARKSRWKASDQELFRGVFTRTDAGAEPVAGGSRSKDYDPIPNFATLRTYRSRKTSARTSRVRYCLLWAMPGWIARKTTWGTRSTLIGIFTSTHRHVRWKKLTRI